MTSLLLPFGSPKISPNEATKVFLDISKAGFDISETGRALELAKQLIESQFKSETSTGFVSEGADGTVGIKNAQ